VAFSTRKVATGLVNRKVIFRPGEMNGGDQAEGTGVGLFKSRLAGHHLFPFDLCEATPLWVSLLDEIAFHLFKILSHVISPLQETRRIWYRKDNANSNHQITNPR
jgi:hypothetical protein